MRLSSIVMLEGHLYGLLWLFPLAVALGSAVPGHADASASHKVVVQVQPVSGLVLRGGDIELLIPLLADGTTSSAINASCSLEWMTNEPNQKITVTSSLPHPQCSLTVEAIGVQGGSPTGLVELGGPAQDLILGLTPGLGHCKLQYTAQAAGFKQPSLEIHVVTYTLTDRR
ncbi:MAG: hypothetical protein ACUVX8_01570 [Candidatus Zipacnadales bacterium]